MVFCDFERMNVVASVGMSQQMSDFTMCYVSISATLLEGRVDSTKPQSDVCFNVSVTYKNAEF